MSTELIATATDEVTVQERLFELAQRKAKIYAQSSLVPKEYQGNIGNVLIAQNMAQRMGADTLMVMQNLYIVHNRPGWSAQFLIACFNSCGRFSAIKYRFDGQPGTEAWGCVAHTRELATGEAMEGTRISIGMAKKEGWLGKNGSKWQTMPEQMMRYRAATFLIRATAPEIGMGLMTKEEIDDSMTIDEGSPAAARTLEDVMARRSAIGNITAPETTNGNGNGNVTHTESAAVATESVSQEQTAATDTTEVPLPAELTEGYAACKTLTEIDAMEKYGLTLGLEGSQIERSHGIAEECRAMVGGGKKKGEKQGSMIG